MQPASTVMELASGLTARMRFIRSSRTTTLRPSAGGVAAPHMPVFPPCGTTRTPCSAQSRTTDATCSVLAGFTTATARPW